MSTDAVIGVVGAAFTFALWRWNFWMRRAVRAELTLLNLRTRAAAEVEP